MAFDLLPIIEAIAPMANAAIPSVVGGLMTALFLRGNTKASEFEKIKIGKFNEALDDLLKSGKISYFELYKCKNFLDVAKKADEMHSEILAAQEDTESDQQGSPDAEPMMFDFDWFIRFFDSAGSVSNEEMQLLWARILAGEVHSPGSFSLRALETLHNMTQTEAVLFQRATSLMLMEYDGSMFIYRSDYQDFEASDIELNEKYGLGANEFATLEECGLLSSIKQDSYATLVEESTGIYSENIVLVIQAKPKGKTAKKSEPLLEYNCYMFTQAAQQLISIVCAEPDDNYIIDLGLGLRKRYPDFLISAYRINSVEGNKITCDASLDLLEI